MIEFPIEKRIEKYDALPERLRQELNSDESANMVWVIGEAHHFSEDRTRKLLKVVAYIILGFIHLEDLPKEIVSEAGVDKRLADEIAREIQLKILNPIMPEIQKLSHYGSASSPQAAPPQPEIMRPSFTPRGQETGSRKQELEVNRTGPFILHEEQKETESVRPADETLVRPSFYDPPSREASEGQGETRLRQDYGGQARDERPMVARLEIGNIEERATKGPPVGKTETEKIRVVHYSGPQTPVDPFNPSVNQTQEVPEEPIAPSSDVHPENIIDLKDLPK